MDNQNSGTMILKIIKHLYMLHESGEWPINWCTECQNLHNA